MADDNQQDTQVGATIQSGVYDSRTGKTTWGPTLPARTHQINRQQFFRGDPNAPDENRISPVPDHARTTTSQMRRGRAKPSR
ncbi:MAG TPA: hypothetical protein VMX16_15515 [Terriglobia bacterium]|nr:hypothetical protein [Terriglobia bacterium]